MSFSVDLLRRCWFLAGPTASGKSAVALELAESLNAEIVALDSMTLYRGMDIGTAKPSAADRERVPHHLFDILAPSEEFSVAEFCDAAARVSAEIVSRNRIPLFVGGAGLYLRSLLRGLFAGPAASPAIRTRWQEYCELHGPNRLHQRLAEFDPVTAARLPPEDVRRVIRALEVQELTGRPFSAQQEQGPRPMSERPAAVFWLSPPRSWLHRRINDRVVEMFAAGFIDEVRGLRQQLHAAGECWSHTAAMALGYREINRWLDQPVATVSDLIPEIQTRTRQFAKRQMTWFRNLEECAEYPIRGDEPPAAIAAGLLAAVKSRATEPV